jgi:hypothetical protein
VSTFIISGLISSVRPPLQTLSAALDYILRFRSTTMADKYRIAHDGPDFIVNYDAGVTVGVYQSEQEAKLEIEVCAHDDFMLETARSLVNAAVEAYMRLHNIDRRTACGWITEAVA